MFEFVKYQACNYIISPGCLPVPVIMSNIGSKTLHYLLEVKKEILVHGLFLIKYCFED